MAGIFGAVVVRFPFGHHRGDLFALGRVNPVLRLRHWLKLAAQFPIVRVALGFRVFHLVHNERDNLCRMVTSSAGFPASRCQQIGGNIAQRVSRRRDPFNPVVSRHAKWCAERQQRGQSRLNFLNRRLAE